MLTGCQRSDLVARVERKARRWPGGALQLPPDRDHEGISNTWLHSLSMTSETTIDAGRKYFG